MAGSQTAPTSGKEPTMAKTLSLGDPGRLDPRIDPMTMPVPHSRPTPATPPTTRGMATISSGDWAS